MDTRRSLRDSFQGGIFASIMVGMTEHYLTPFAIALRASVQAVGALAALPNLAASLFHLVSCSWALRLKSRRRFIVLGALTQAGLLLPIALLPAVSWPHPVTLFVSLVVLLATAGAMIGPAWGSLMTDHIPANERGRYFGWRNQRLGIVTVASQLTAGLILHQLHPVHPLAGFTVLCLFAMIARLISAALLARMDDLPLQVTADSHFTFWMFIRRFRESNFVRFVCFVSAMTFCANVASPFFSVFLLRDLRVSYLVYTILTLSAVMPSLGSLRLWGQHADHVGNVRVLRLTSIVLPIIPVLWLVSTHTVYLVGVQLLAGFVWGGFNLAASNFIYDAVSPAKRMRCIAYFNVLNGTALSLGALLGGALADHLPPLLGYPLRSLFVLSAGLRGLVVLFLRPTFREVRPTREATSLDLFFSVVGIKPLERETSSENPAVTPR